MYDQYVNESCDSVIGIWCAYTYADGAGTLGVTRGRDSAVGTDVL